MAGGRFLRLGLGGLFFLAAVAAVAEPAADEAAALDLKHSEALLSARRLAATGHHIRASAAVIGGKASYYSRRLHGRLVATGEVFRNELLTAASNIFPLNSWLAVRRAGGKCVVVRVNDRMHRRHRERIVDLFYAAAKHLGIIASGVAAVEARLLPPGFDRGRQDCAQAFTD
jgi:rare lipoprotein A